MKNLFIDASHYLPFISMIISTKESAPIVTRLLEAGIIGGIIMYGVQSVQAEKIDSIKQDLTEIKQQNSRFTHDLLEMRIDVERLKQRNQYEKQNTLSRYRWNPNNCRYVLNRRNHIC